MYSDCAEQVRMKIRRRTQVLCSLIGEYEGMLLQETERRHRQNLSTLQQRRIAVMQHAASITAVTEMTDKLLHFGSEVRRDSRASSMPTTARHAVFRLPSPTPPASNLVSVTDLSTHKPLKP